MLLKKAGFSKQFRLLQRTDFVKMSLCKTTFSCRSFLVVWQKNSFSYSRLGITASRKSGSSVVRNRIKRYVREYFRLHRNIVPGVDIHVIVRRQAAEGNSVVLFSELQRAFQQIGSCTCSQKFL